MEMFRSSVVRTKHGFTTGRVIVLMIALMPIALVVVTPVSTQQVLAQTQDARKAQADQLL